MLRTAVILAGGLGTRLREAVPALPKPMAPVLGRPFLELLMDYWISQGIREFVLSVGYRHDAIQAHFGSHYRGAEIEYVVEPEPVGTGGGLMLAARATGLDNRFLLLNGDTYFAVDLKELERTATGMDADWCFSVFRSHDTTRYLGMRLSPDGRVTSLRASCPDEAQWVNGGVYCVHPRSLATRDHQLGPKFSLEGDYFPAALRSGQRLFALECPGAFIDIGIPDDYQRAADIISASGINVRQ